MKEIDDKLYDKLLLLGIINEDKDDTRSYNVSKSNYSEHIVQPWTIWLEYGLNPWDADIIKRVLRTKGDEPSSMDYEKIIHICKERLRQISIENKLKSNNIDFENVE